MLTELQGCAKSGELAAAMAGYIQWLAQRMDEMKISLAKRRDEIRAELRKSRISHDRTPDNTASLALGLEVFLTFAEDKGAIDAKKREQLLSEGMKALLRLGEQQREQHADSNPAELFLRLLRAAFSSGKCHLKDKNDQYADNPEIWGWTNAGDYETPDYRSQGDCIGWTDSDDIFLEPTSSFKIAQLMGQNGSGTLPIGLKTLNKRLKEAGLPATTDETRGTTTVRKTLQDQVREVLHMRSDVFWRKTGEE